MLQDPGDFGKRLALIIHAREDLTSSGLSIRAGLDNSAIRAIISGKARSPRLDTAMKICEALGTDLYRFLAADLADLERGILPGQALRLDESALQDFPARMQAVLSHLTPSDKYRLLLMAEVFVANQDTIRAMEEAERQA